MTCDKTLSTTPDRMYEQLKEVKINGTWIEVEVGSFNCPLLYKPMRRCLQFTNFFPIQCISTWGDSPPLFKHSHLPRHFLSLVSSSSCCSCIIFCIVKSWKLFWPFSLNHVPRSWLTVIISKCSNHRRASWVCNRSPQCAWASHASVGKLPDVGSIVVLGDVNTADSTDYEREAAFNYVISD